MALAARLILAAVFAVAGIAKLMDRDGARQAARAFGVPGGAVAPVAALLPVAELAVAASLLSTRAAVGGAIGALVLLAMFIAGITISLARGRQPDCRCFGQLHSAPIGWKTLARNGALAAAATGVVFEGPGNGVATWSSGLTGIEWLALIVAVALVVAFVLEGSALTNRWWHRRRRRAHAGPGPGAIHRQPSDIVIPPSSGGLPLGTPAPDFSLPGLDGERVTLGALRASARPVMLIFADPGCLPCAPLLPDVGRWQVDHAAMVTVAVVSQGTVAFNQVQAGEHGITNVVLQEGLEVARAYRFAGLPGAVVIGADGAIASPMVTGADPIRRLMQSVLDRELPPRIHV